VPQYVVFLAVNRKPRLAGTDWGIWRRVKIVEFTQTFTGERKDDRLDDKLAAELTGILTWALKGLHAWKAQGLGTCAAVERATLEYRDESDVLGAWLREQTKVFDEKPGESPHDANVHFAYAAYKDFVIRQGARPLSEPQWKQRLRERGYVITRESRYPEGRQGKQRKIPVIRNLQIISSSIAAGANGSIFVEHDAGDCQGF